MSALHVMSPSLISMMPFLKQWHFNLAVKMLTHPSNLKILQCKPEMSFRKRAQKIGLLVACFPGVLFGPPFYKQLENEKKTP